MAQQQPESDLAYAIALERIADCHQSGKTSLDLSGLGLSTLPPEIGQLTMLTALNLHGNQLKTLPPEIGQLTALASLSVYDNELSTFPPEIGQLTALMTVSFHGNQFSMLPPEIGQFIALRSLYLGRNQLSALPPEIGQLTALISLYLFGNQLSTLPREIEQLTALTELDVRENRLEALPESVSRLPSLRRLRVQRNPLPEELLQLSGGQDGDGTKLIEFLRARAAAQSSGDAAALRRFDEAKLLLVGPGNVGKTWLLHALQGKVPQKKTDSTKGIEIAREPLDVPHPTQNGRMLHLTCWDFGGQEHFQVTHQIFFSAKAVYLLVWKPREGFDPEMAARLERIQLSAGRSAKVLIVSTHADGTVPTVIGQDALRERFGDLIWDFYEVDSAEGPTGTGIAELKLAIAQAAAQLDGMELDFPATWHAAQQAVRAIEEPAVPFKQIVRECRKHGLEASTADTLAQLMAVQGHAVYFPDAATDEEAGPLADENVVVLRPEWLAKAVGFVIEDKPTIAAEGILSHERLAAIWKREKKRDCPGYKKALRGYLLWLMWKFDLAYKQDANTSLVPEMIARNRPDDLLWNPRVKTQSREVRAVCVFTSEQTRKVIAAPKAMMPALTAAVHPLRQRHDPQDPDKLDRNWNSGFFLHTQERGDAYVELNDRELQLVVRHDYPAMLFEQILKTLKGLGPKRWPNAVLDLRVPCVGKVENQPCPGLFKKDWLDEQRGATISCQDCRRADLKVDELLEGFDPRNDEILNRLRALQDGQRGLLAAAHSLFMALDPANEERRRGPSLFTILPEKGKRFSGVGFDHVRLTCWCEHPDGPHPGSPIGSNDSPDYVLKVPQDWLVKASPYISWAVTLLKAFTPLAGNITGQITSASGMDVKDAVALMKDSASALPSGKLEIGEGRAFEVERGEMFGDAYARHLRPELAALRHIHDLLDEQIPKPKRWGKLNPVLTKSGDILWLCPQHAAIQSPPPQQL